MGDRVGRDEVNEFNIRRRLVQIFQGIDETAGRRAGSAKKDPMAWLNGEHSQFSRAQFFWEARFQRLGHCGDRGLVITAAFNDGFFHCLSRLQFPVSYTGDDDLIRILLNALRVIHGRLLVAVFEANDEAHAVP